MTMPPPDQAGQPGQPGQPPYGYQQPAYGYQQPPAGYGAPPPYGYPVPPPQGKRRPSAWWFLPGALGLVLAVACGVLFGVTVVRTLSTDGYVAADGERHTVTLDDSGDRMLFFATDTGTPTCTVDGLPADDITDDVSDYDVGTDGETWLPFAEFSTDDTSVDLVCTAADGIPEDVRIGPPLGESQLITIGVTAIGALAFGVLGLVGTIVVAVLYISRRPRT